jgi:hypothetical protein
MCLYTGFLFVGCAPDEEETHALSMSLLSEGHISFSSFSLLRSGVLTFSLHRTPLRHSPPIRTPCFLPPLCSLLYVIVHADLHYHTSSCRYVCLLAAGDPSTDVRAEAERGLNRVLSEIERAAATSADSAPAGTPSEAADAPAGAPSESAAQAAVGGAVERPMPPFADATRYIAEQFASAGRGLAPDVFARGIRFLRHCLGLSAGALEDDEEFEKRGSLGGSRLLLISEHLDAVELHATLNKGGDASSSSSPVDLYRGLLERALETDQPSALQVEGMMCLLELIAAIPAALAPRYTDRVDWLLAHVSSSVEATRERAARIIGIVAAGV